MLGYARADGMAHSHRFMTEHVGCCIHADIIWWVIPYRGKNCCICLLVPPRDLLPMLEQVMSPEHDNPPTNRLVTNPNAMPFLRRQFPDDITPPLSLTRPTALLSPSGTPATMMGLPHRPSPPGIHNVQCLADDTLPYGAFPRGGLSVAYRGL